MNNISRRDALRVGGLSVFGAAFLAACGKQSGVVPSANILSEGVVPPTTALPAGIVTDVVLLRTAASLEYNAIDTYNAVLEGGLLTGDYAKLTDAVKRFRDDHQAHADAVNQLVVASGGKAHTCANSRIDTLYIQPALELITAKDNPDMSKDIVALAHALENLATQTYQGVVASLTSPSLRGDAIRVAQDEARHAVVLAQVLNGGYASVGPTTNEATGKPNIASVPSAYGSLSSVLLQVGTPNADGVKAALTLETPSLNGLIYDFVDCQ
jgi:demethoxyubiquinone hydroxylase (CLK1/Coq7/Cat5 family)